MSVKQGKGGKLESRARTVTKLKTKEEKHSDGVAVTSGKKGRLAAASRKLGERGRWPTGRGKGKKGPTT